MHIPKLTYLENNDLSNQNDLKLDVAWSMANTVTQHFASLNMCPGGCCMMEQFRELAPDIKWPMLLEPNKGLAKHSRTKEYEANIMTWLEFTQCKAIDAQLNVKKKKACQNGR